MIVLDTNVISELMRSQPDPNVLNWANDRKADTVTITSITYAEILEGIHRLPDGQRKQRLFAALARVRQSSLDAILVFDQNAAEVYGTLSAELRGVGKIVSQADLMIASICRLVGAELITRNVKDFQYCGISVRNPFLD